MRSAFERLTAPSENVPQSVLSLSRDIEEASPRGFSEQFAPPDLGFSEVASIVRDVAMTDPAKEQGMAILSNCRESTSFCIRGVRAIEIRLFPAHAAKTHPRGDGIGCRQPSATNIDHRVKRILRFLEVELLLEIHRICEERRCD